MDIDFNLELQFYIGNILHLAKPCVWEPEILCYIHFPELVCEVILIFISRFQLDVTSAQLLVTDNDFRDKDFRKQLTETVESLLALKVIPVFNENDAVSTRKAPYEVCWRQYLICLWNRWKSLICYSLVAWYDRGWTWSDLENFLLLTGKENKKLTS